LLDELQVFFFFLSKDELQVRFKVDSE